MASRPDLTNIVVVNPAVSVLLPFFFRCSPKILIVVDGLDYNPTNGFGLSRFIQAITTGSGRPLTPTLTLATRAGAAGTTTNISIYGVNYPVLNGFSFSSAATAVTTANYDQIWMFGLQPVGSPPANAALSNPEVGVVADFMNAGGGVFSTGDHAALGQGMGGRLPRIRHMREWASIPMGNEALPGVRDRIDTVVNPGSNSTYEFNDQSDDIPQRIYPNYAVTGSNPGWTATIHPVLLLAGGQISRTGPAGFANDMDVLPDHPHESVCYEVSATSKSAAFSGSYTEAGRNFAEFPLRSGSTTLRVPGELVAFGVSGGRAIDRSDVGIIKPPVNPRMFGIIGAFDGHAAQPYTTNGPRPGRIVVDSTWHHYVNINLDGTGSGRTGLGTGSDTSFAPSPDLLKIYRYYQNMVNWLQPANRIWCSWWTDVVVTTFNPHLIEEIISLPPKPGPEPIIGIGLAAKQAFEEMNGIGSTRHMLASMLRAHGKMDKLTAMLEGEEAVELDTKVQMATAFALGKLVIDIAAKAPDGRAETLAASMKKGHEKLEAAALELAVNSFAEGLKLQQQRVDRQAKALKSALSLC